MSEVLNMPNGRTEEREKGNKIRKEGSNIVCYLAQSHIDSLHTAQSCQAIFHTQNLIHQFSLFPMCPTFNHTAAPAMLKLNIPPEIEKKEELGGCSKTYMGFNNCKKPMVSIHSWFTLQFVRKTPRRKLHFF